MTSRRRRNYTVKAVSEVDKFSGIACSIISSLVVESGLGLSLEDNYSLGLDNAAVEPIATVHWIDVYGYAWLST